MTTTQQNRGTKPTDWIPFLLGIGGLFVGAIYQAQRDGLFLNSFYSFDRFIQHHLDATGWTADILALVGMVVGLVMLCVRGRDPILSAGTAFSAIVILMVSFGTSL